MKCKPCHANGGSAFLKGGSIVTFVWRVGYWPGFLVDDPSVIRIVARPTILQGPGKVPFSMAHFALNRSTRLRIELARFLHFPAQVV